MERSKIADEHSENVKYSLLETTNLWNNEVRFWQSVSLSLAIFVLSILASLVIALVLMLATR